MLNEGRSVQSLERALDLLERVAAADDGMTLRELSVRTGLKPPTVHNLLRTLVMRGYVAKLTGPVRYGMGSAVQELAGRASRDRVLRAAEGELRALAKAFPEARVSLVTLVAGEPVMRLRLAPGAKGTVEPPGSGPMAPYATASALAFQAFGEGEAVAEFRRRHPFWEQGAMLWQSPEKLEAALARFRRQGAVSLSLRGEALSKLAAPVFGVGHVFEAAVGAALPADAAAANRKALLSAVREAAERLSR